MIVLLYVLSLVLAGLRRATATSTVSVRHGQWAVVTGASDGIGKEFAIQLAKKGFSIVLISRSRDKLLEVQSLIRQSSPNAETLVYPFDFTTTDASKYLLLKQQLEQRDVGCLVNNVAMSHSFPVPFIEEDALLVDQLLQCNMSAQLKVTRIVLPQMISRRGGTILNIGSLLGQITAPCLSIYAATKAFLRSFSKSLAYEVAGSGVHVHHINAGFVATQMSKMKPSWMAPTPKKFVRAVLGSAGSTSESSPFLVHSIFNWLISVVPDSFTTSQVGRFNMSLRNHVLRKREKESSKKKL